MNSSEKKKFTPKRDYYLELDSAKHRLAGNVFDSK